MKYNWQNRRTKPYSEIGIRRVPCARCGKEARYQWNVCADDNLYRPLCAECDVQLNALVLAWVGHPQAYTAIRKYAFGKGVSLADVAKLGADKGEKA